MAVVFNQLIKQDEIYRQVRSLCKEKICQVWYKLCMVFIPLASNDDPFLKEVQFGCWS